MENSYYIQNGISRALLGSIFCSLDFSKMVFEEKYSKVSEVIVLDFEGKFIILLKRGK